MEKQTKLKKKYEKELEKVINKKLKKIIQVIKKIESDGKTAETKLAYLDPKKQMIPLFIILLISFLGVVLANLIKNDIYNTVLIILVIVIFFILVLVLLWKLLSIIVEVKKIIDDDKKRSGNKN